MNLRLCEAFWAWERFQVSFLASQICQTRALLEVWITPLSRFAWGGVLFVSPTWANFARFFPCVSLCVCLHACTQQFTNHQHRRTCMFRRRLDQTAFGFIYVAKHVQRACLILTLNTRVFHNDHIHYIRNCSFWELLCPQSLHSAQRPVSQQQSWLVRLCTCKAHRDQWPQSQKGPFASQPLVCDSQVGAFFRAELRLCITVPTVRASLGNCTGGSVLQRAHAPKRLVVLRLPTTFRVTDFVPASTSYTNTVALVFPAVAESKGSCSSCSSCSSYSSAGLAVFRSPNISFTHTALGFCAFCLRSVTARKSQASCCTLLVVTQSIWIGI